MVFPLIFFVWVCFNVMSYTQKKDALARKNGSTTHKNIRK